MLWGYMREGSEGGLMGGVVVMKVGWETRELLGERYEEHGKF
jgi:hypothetical protein